MFQEPGGSVRKGAVSFKQSLKEAGLDDDGQDTVTLVAGVPSKIYYNNNNNNS